MNFVTETASNAMMFAPGGGFAKGAGRLGLINPNGRYHMGIGQYNAKQVNFATANTHHTTSMGN
ncbi:hypothetical protein [Helicobacter cinaedi]|uniref:hypothetical protein n=1 Tax=Helicobacter cinaedi TaxID=213 RepID=UPI001057B448|nr:hypothetical protein [Helicobacter cinaedi]